MAFLILNGASGISIATYQQRQEQQKRKINTVLLEEFDISSTEYFQQMSDQLNLQLKKEIHI